VKRSVTVRPDLNEAILESVGSRGYSAFINEAVLLALQAQGIEETIAEYEREHGPIPEETMNEARRRRAEAAAEAQRR
jgi:hypothetical protein